MRYIQVTWVHHLLDEPIELYSELDDQSWEVRKMEVFSDGRSGFAEAKESSGTTMLGLEPVPSLSEIARDQQFRPIEIAKAKFDRIWELARTTSPIQP